MWTSPSGESKQQLNKTTLFHCAVRGGKLLIKQEIQNGHSARKYEKIRKSARRVRRRKQEPAPRKSRRRQCIQTEQRERWTFA